MRRTITFAIVILTILYQPPATDALTITFDDIPSAIYDFSASPPVALPLLEQYASSGVHFSGPLNSSDPTKTNGGAILHTAGSASFPSGAHSGNNSLAFNSLAHLATGGQPIWPETILFDNLWSSVSFWVAPQVTPGLTGTPTFSVVQYVGTNKDELAPVTFTASANDWTQFSVTSDKGIKALVLSRTDATGISFTLDDLVLTPEPGTVILLGLGFLGIGLAIRKRK